jgi:hypothetical protein
VQITYSRCCIGYNHESCVCLCCSDGGWWTKPQPYSALQLSATGSFSIDWASSPSTDTAILSIQLYILPVGAGIAPGESHPSRIYMCVDVEQCVCLQRRDGPCPSMPTISYRHVLSADMLSLAACCLLWKRMNPTPSRLLPCVVRHKLHLSSPLLPSPLLSSPLLSSPLSTEWKKPQTSDWNAALVLQSDASNIE